MQERKKPETLRLRTVSPSLTVDDIEATLQWYTDVVGFIETHRFENDDGELVGASVRAGEVEIFLGQDDWQQGRDRNKGVGFRIFCSTVQDLDQLAADIQARGGTLDHEPQDREWGSRDFALTDPSGFKITISTPFEM